MPLRVLRLPDLDKEKWARLAAVGRLFTELSMRGYRNSFYMKRAGTTTELRWCVTVRVDKARVIRSSGPNIETALERALTRLLEAQWKDEK